MAEFKSSVPVLDCDAVGLNVSDANLNTEQMRKLGEQLVESVASVGICYLVNHGIPKEMIDGYNENLNEFFIQPREIKEKYGRGDEISGWTESGTISTNPDRPADLRELFTFCPEDITISRNIWPNDKMQASCMDVFETFQSFTLRLCDCLSLGLGFNKTAIRDALLCIGKQGSRTALGSMYYPAIQDEATLKPGQIRLGEHVDTSIITLLSQDDIGGLEAEVPGQGFVPVPPCPGTLVFVTGGLMNRLTSDRILAVRHRVVIPESEVKVWTPRQSVVFFVQPDDDYVVKPLDGSNKYPPITSMEYFKIRLKDLGWK